MLKSLIPVSAHKTEEDLIRRTLLISGIFNFLRDLRPGTTSQQRMVRRENSQHTDTNSSHIATDQQLQSKGNTVPYEQQLWKSLYDNDTRELFNPLDDQTPLNPDFANMLRDGKMYVANFIAQTYQGMPPNSGNPTRPTRKKHITTLGRVEQRQHRSTRPRNRAAKCSMCREVGHTRAKCPNTKEVLDKLRMRYTQQLPL